MPNIRWNEMLKRSLRDSDFWTLSIAMIAFLISALPNNTPSIDDVTATYFDMNPFWFKYLIITDLEDIVSKILQLLGGAATLYFVVKNKKTFEARFLNALFCFCVSLLLSIPVRVGLNYYYSSKYMPKLLSISKESTKSNFEVLNSDNETLKVDARESLMRTCRLLDVDCQNIQADNALMIVIIKEYESWGMEI